MKHVSRNCRGPVSRKVLAALDKHLGRKVINLAAFRMGAERAANLERGVVSEEQMRGMDPLHAVYGYAQNKLSAMVEDLAQLPMCAELAEAYMDAEEEYLPSGPPMSPLTGSYFFCWAVFDSHVGKHEETFATVAIDLCRRLGTEPSLVRLFEHLQNSRMGLYLHEGHAGAHVMLREFVTGRRQRCAVPTGYRGSAGEIWYARVLPEPFDSLGLGYSLVFTTPYIILRREAGQYLGADPQDWVAFFERSMPKTGLADAGQAYEHLMKYGLSPEYWNEYVFEAYVNHRPDMILLAGLPDVPSSRPHSPFNEDRPM
ncbi:MAG: hypothetical protein H7A45_19525 [Verrucomicrobiales bacterium]|nr:hypothetical protein [Verrucomicrobiales bacterium]